MNRQPRRLRLHYLIAGKGPAVVLLHGWPQTSHMWRDILPGLAARYPVVAPDLRGLDPIAHFVPKRNLRYISSAV